jgi:ketopantoate reductase
MQLDFEKGNANELEALTGYVRNEAKKLGIDVPLYNMAYDKLKIIA